MNAKVDYDDGIVIEFNGDGALFKVRLDRTAAYRLSEDIAFSVEDGDEEDRPRVP